MKTKIYLFQTALSTWHRKLIFLKLFGVNRRRLIPRFQKSQTGSGASIISRVIAEKLSFASANVKTLYHFIEDNYGLLHGLNQFRVISFIEND